MNTMVLRSSGRSMRARSSSCRISRVCASSAANGSSISRINGFITSARTRPTRCCIPPESWYGIMALEAGEPDQVEIMRDPGFDFGARHARHRQPEGRVVEDGLPREQAEMLKDHGNSVGRAGADRLAVDEKLAATEIGEARDAAQKRGLAAARGAHDAHDLVALDRKRQLMEGDDGAIEKELAGTVGDNGWINDCLPGTHAFPRSRRRSTSPSGRRIKSREKICRVQCEAPHGRAWMCG